MDGAFRAKISRLFISFEIWRGCASFVLRPPLNWAILRFMVKGIGRRECAALFSRPVCLQFGTEREGKMGARVEN